MSQAAAAPSWANSSHGLGRLIQGVIGVGLLRRPLFHQARQLIIRTAERNGIPWRARREHLRQAAAPLLELSTNSTQIAPEYYRVRFHAYEQGNLCWQAAAEAEQATDAMALRVWPEDKLTPAQPGCGMPFMQQSSPCWMAPCVACLTLVAPLVSVHRRWRVG